MMKLAILAAPGLIPYLSDKLESTGQAAGVKLDLYDYGHLSTLPELYPKLRDKYDGFLLSGLVVQTAIQRYFPEDDSRWLHSILSLKRYTMRFWTFWTGTEALTSLRWWWISICR